MNRSYKSLRRLLDVIDHLVDDRVGIIHSVVEIPRRAGDPEFFQYLGQACNTQALSGKMNFSATGGVSTDRESAIAKAVGEAVERYCSAFYETDEMPLCSYESATFPCVAADKFALYSHEQYRQQDFPYVPFETTTPVRWAQVINPMNGEVTFLPAAMVYLPYYYDFSEQESPIVQPMSTGLACHCSTNEAAIGAICEVIERDAFTITWQAALARPCIVVETLDDANYDRVNRFRDAGHSVTLFDITLDVGVPTVLSVLRNNVPQAPALVLAAAADLSPERAVCKSLEELEHTRRYSQLITSHMPRLVPDPQYKNVVDQISHLNFWCDHINAPLADFLFASDKRIDFNEMTNLATGDAGQDLDGLLAKLHTIGHQSFIVDITTPDIEELGLVVMRAVIPGFHPMFLGHELRALGGSRLWEIPQKLGYRGVDRITGDNPIPHPFP